jgi:hypothetical protein
MKVLTPKQLEVLNSVERIVLDRALAMKLDGTQTQKLRDAVCEHYKRAPHNFDPYRTLSEALAEMGLALAPSPTGPAAPLPPARGDAGTFTPKPAPGQYQEPTAAAQAAQGAARTYQQLQAEREEYREWLRRKGLQNPAFGWPERGKFNGG